LVITVFTSGIKIVFVMYEICGVNLHVQGLPKKCIHTLTKENSMLYVSTKFNYASQVEYKLQ